MGVVPRLDKAPFGKYTVKPTHCHACRRCGFCNWGFTSEDRDDAHKAWARKLSIDYLDLYSNEVSCRGDEPSGLHNLRKIRGAEIE